MTESIINKVKVNYKLNIKDAVKKMDECGIGFCVGVDDDGHVVGVLSDGDFRRAVINKIDLNKNLSILLNKKYIHLAPDYKHSDVIKIFESSVAQHIPIIKDNKLIDLVIKENYLSEKNVPGNNKMSPVVIMAGGKGTRLDPFTRILPKPLIPLGDEPICKRIMDEFHKYGAKEFFISVFEKKDMIKAYFSGVDLPYTVDYVEEKKPLGTAGALSNLSAITSKSLIVTNCDVLIKTDYASLHRFHEENNYDLTIVASISNYEIPYGVCEIDSKGNFAGLKEKPSYEFLINVGLYIIKSEFLSHIPLNQIYNMNQFIDLLNQKNCNIGVYPIAESSWSDVGQWKKYWESIKELER